MIVDRDLISDNFNYSPCEFNVNSFMDCEKRSNKSILVNRIDFWKQVLFKKQYRRGWKYNIPLGHVGFEHLSFFIAASESGLVLDRSVEPFDLSGHADFEIDPHMIPNLRPLRAKANNVLVIFEKSYTHADIIKKSLNLKLCNNTMYMNCFDSVNHLYYLIAGLRSSSVTESSFMGYFDEVEGGKKLAHAVVAKNTQNLILDDVRVANSFIETCIKRTYKLNNLTLYTTKKFGSKFKHNNFANIRTLK